MSGVEIDNTALKTIPGLVGPKDLRMEEYREYVFLPEEGSAEKPAVYRIENPIAFYYREGGTTHRVVTADGKVHCPPFGAGQRVVLRWKNRDAKDPVSY